MLRRSINGIFIVLTTIVLLGLFSGNAYGQKGGSPSTDTSGGSGKAIGDVGPGGITVGSQIAPQGAKSSRPSDALDLAPRARSAGRDDILPPPQPAKKKEEPSRRVPPQGIIGPPMATPDDILPPPGPEKKKEPVKRPTVEPPGPIPIIVPEARPLPRPTNEPPGPIPNIVPPPQSKKQAKEPFRDPRVPPVPNPEVQKSPVKDPTIVPRPSYEPPGPIPNIVPPPQSKKAKEPIKDPHVPPQVVVTDKYPKTQ